MVGTTGRRLSGHTGRESKLKIGSGVCTGTPTPEMRADAGQEHTEVLSSCFEDKRAQERGGAEKAEGRARTTSRVGLPG